MNRGSTEGNMNAEGRLADLTERARQRHEYDEPGWHDIEFLLAQIVPRPPDLTWAEKEAIADEVNAVRRDRFLRSLDIECPECGMGVAQQCRIPGGNHTARMDAVSDGR